MPDPIQGTTGATSPTGPVPRPTLGSLTNGEAPAVNASIALVNGPQAAEAGDAPAMAQDSTAGQLARPTWRVGGWHPAQEPAPDPTVPQLPERELAPWIADRLKKTMEGIVARRTERPAAPTRVAPAWDPATAGTNGDGSLEPPTAKPTTGAPAPGQGRAVPTGLKDGNSVFRFGPGGAPTNFTILDQGSTNGCGTTSLAMVLNFLAGGKPAFDREKVDRQIRHYNLFTSPGDVAAFAERQGLEASVRTGTTLEELRGLVDQGLPVQVLLDVSDAQDGSGLHYEVVTGYGTGPDGKRYIELANPWGQREFMAEDAFLARWGDLGAKGFPLGIDRVAIPMKPPGHPARLPGDDRDSFADTGMTALRVAEGLTQVTSGWARRDAATVTGGAIRLVFGGLAAIPTLLANAGGEWGASYAKEGWGQLGKGFGETLKGLGKIAAGGATWAATRPLELAGNVVSRGVDLIASGAKAAVGGLGKVFSSL